MGSFDFGLLIILGLAVFGGTIGARLFQRFRIPQVAGYIAMGFAIGDLGFGIITPANIEQFDIVNLFALGIIGFLVGSELRLKDYRGRGAQLLSILIGEGLGAFIAVGAATGAVVYWLTRDAATASVAGFVFGSIAAATDPGATAGVLWEYRARGPLTAVLLALVALDDALAMSLYGIAVGSARLLGGDAESLGIEALRVAWYVGGAIVLGGVAGLLIFGVIRWLKKHDQSFVCLIGTLLLVIGVCANYQIDILLTTLTLGAVLVNLAPRQSRELFDTLRSFLAPIYALFIVLVGARLDVAEMTGVLWIIVGAYLLARCIGKVTGVYLGGLAAGVEPAVRNFGGLGLIAQGGLAVGLAVVAGRPLESIALTESLSLGEAVVFGVTSATLLVQIIGPAMIRLSASLADETGRDVTEQDVIDLWTVKDVMKSGISPLALEMPLSRVFRIFGENDHTVYPVVDREGIPKGVIALEDLKEVIASQDTWSWVLAADVMMPIRYKVGPDEPLQSALDYMETRGLDELPVVENEAQRNQALGILDRRTIRIRVNEEVLKRRQPGLS